MKNNVDELYHRRCLKKLKEWHAPTKDWYCVEVEDVGEHITDEFDEGKLSTCELCGCNKVRYLHHMEHPQYFETIQVGCICAGILEGNILAAKQREQWLKNRNKRRTTFLKKPWKKTVNGNYFLKRKGKDIFINVMGCSFTCSYENQTVRTYKGKRISNFLTAQFAAFDMVDKR